LFYFGDYQTKVKFLMISLKPFFILRFYADILLLLLLFLLLYGVVLESEVNVLTVFIDQINAA